MDFLPDLSTSNPWLTVKVALCLTLVPTHSCQCVTMTTSRSKTIWVVKVLKDLEILGQHPNTFFTTLLCQTSMLYTICCFTNNFLTILCCLDWNCEKCVAWMGRWLDREMPCLGMTCLVGRGGGTPCMTAGRNHMYGSHTPLYTLLYIHLYCHSEHFVVHPLYPLYIPLLIKTQ